MIGSWVLELALTPFNYWAFVVGAPIVVRIVTLVFDGLLLLAIVGLVQMVVT